MKATTVALIAIVVFSATAIFVGSKHEEYNRYEFHAASDRDTVAGYRMDKRTGKIALVAGKTIIATTWKNPYEEIATPSP